MGRGCRLTDVLVSCGRRAVPQAMLPRLQDAFPHLAVDWARWPDVQWPEPECSCRTVEKRGAVKRQQEEDYAVRWPLRVTQGRPKVRGASAGAWGKGGGMAGGVWPRTSAADTLPQIGLCMERVNECERPKMRGAAGEGAAWAVRYTFRMAGWAGTRVAGVVYTVWFSGLQGWFSGG